MEKNNYKTPKLERAHWYKRKEREKCFSIWIKL